MPKRSVNNRQTNTTDEIIKFLKSKGESPTTTIHEYLNDRNRCTLRNGCTINRLVNLLGKMPEFEQTGTVYLPDRYYEVKVWRLAEWVS